MKTRDVLVQLDLGNSVAEFDAALDRYFVETAAFRALAEDRVDIVSGEKGTGKTALYRVFKGRYTSIGALDEVEVVSGFNPAGNPVFQRLGHITAMPEGQYITIWKAYLLSLVGNWLLELFESDLTPKMRELDGLLVQTGLRSNDDSAETVFSKLSNLVARWVQPRSAEVSLTFDERGIPVISPKLEFDAPAPHASPTTFVEHERALRMLDEALDEVKLTVWVALDRLDEAFQGFPGVEIPALRALFRTYLDLLPFRRLRLKLFVRNDVFRKVIHGGFVNLTHVNARKIDIVWEEEDLLNLVARRVRESGRFVDAAGLNGLGDRQVFDRIFPRQVDQGPRKPTTWSWMMSRIRDGKGVKPPRNLIDLATKAQEAQIRSEDRSPRLYSDAEPLIEADAIRRAHRALSEQRVQDTLLAEAAELVPLIERFRGGKAEHNDDSLAALLDEPIHSVRARIKPLLDVGFLEEIGGSLKVPMLFRDGLDITQGKAFTTEVDDEDEA